MSNLDWVFSLFAVILGLALAEVLTGFARAIRLRHNAALDGRDDVRLGFLTPMLAVFLIFDISSFWIVAWSMRESIQATPPVLAVGVFTTSVYYIAASWVFPDTEARYADLDDYYFRQKSLVFSLIFISNVASYLGRAWVIGFIGMPGAAPFDYTTLALYYLLQVAGIAIKGKRANLAILVALLLLDLEFYTGLVQRTMQTLS